MQKHKKSVLAIFLFAILIVILPIQAFALEFSDVPITASYYKAVDKLSNIGIIQGRGDGAFAPVDKTTRGEFCAFLARANGYNANYYQPKELPFSDVAQKHWATPYISFCYENGYINGYEDGTFQPNTYVTDEQAIKMIVCSSGVGDESLSAIGPRWYSGYLNVAQKYDLLAGTRVQVNNSANRAFVAQVVYNAMMVDGSLENAVQNPDEQPSKDDEEPSQSAKPALIPNDEPDMTEEDLAKENAASATPKPVRKPVNKNGKLLVVVDAGHNYSITDTGASGNGFKEQDLTYQIAAKVRPLLEANGFMVIMTREALTDNVSEESVVASLKRRAEIANESGADLFISIHCNAGGATGTETYYYDESEEGMVLAELIQENVVDEVGLTDRGIKSAGFVVLQCTEMVSALLETGFIDHEKDIQKLTSEKGQMAYAEGIAKGICEYFGKTYQEQ